MDFTGRIVLDSFKVHTNVYISLNLKVCFGIIIIFYWLKKKNTNGLKL